jgi:hypothetical protein
MVALILQLRPLVRLDEAIEILAYCRLAEDGALDVAVLNVFGLNADVDQKARESPSSAKSMKRGEDHALGQRYSVSR